MRAGKLRHVITLLAQEVDTTGPFGASRPLYKAVAQIRGNVTELAGGESIRGTEMVASRSVRIETRYFPGIDNTYQIEYAGRQFEIDFIDNVGNRNREIHITAHESIR